MHWAALCGHLGIVKQLCEGEATHSDKINTSLTNKFDRIPMEEALQARRTEIAEFLAPISVMDEDKVYSELHPS